MLSNLFKKYTTANHASATCSRGTRVQIMLKQLGHVLHGSKSCLSKLVTWYMSANHASEDWARATHLQIMLRLFGHVLYVCKS